MLPIPTSRVFRSRRAALAWAFWVIVAAVMATGFGNPTASSGPGGVTNAVDALGMAVDDDNLKALMGAINAA